MVTTFNFITDSIRDENNRIDIDLTIDKIRNQLISHVSEYEFEQQTINEAVNKVFDENIGKAIYMPSLLNRALSNMHVQIETFGVFRNRIYKFIKDNSGNKREDNKLFRIVKGVNGGVCRWKDLEG